MKIRLAFLDDDDEYDAPNVYDRPPWGSEDARSSMDPFDSRFGPRGKPRLRAPSDDGDTSGSSDVGSDFGGDDNRDSMTFGLSQPAETVPTLSAVSRQDLLRRVEKSCEKRALDAVTSSMAYMSLCGTLKSAHADAERQLDMQSLRTDDASLASLFQRHVDNEVRAKRQLDQLHHNERKAFDQVQKTLEKYQKEQEDRTRAEYEELEREAQARRMADEARREAQRRKEEAASAAAAERREQEEQERTQQDEAAREAAEREAKKKQEEDEQKKQAEARSVMQKASSEYITAGHARIARLETMQAISKEISEMTDPTVKRMRVDIKKMAGACNQISASPSSIRAVVDKIQALLTMARNYDEKVFKFALDIVAGNLAKQARVILDYKACYPLAHVISMSCVRTPELTDVLLGYFNQMCLYTIPQFLKKTQSQSLRDYQLSIGFEVAVGKEGEHGEPELEHVTEYTKRMTMLSAVLAAAMQTKPWDGSPQPAGLGIGDCWMWVARIANDEPDLLTGSLLLTILEVASFELSQTYKQQFHKLLVLIARQVGPRLSKNARTGAANAAGQLEMFITEYEQRGCKIIEPPARKLEESKISQADEEKTDGDKGGGYRGGGGGGYGGGGGGYGGGGRGGGGRGGGGRGGARGRGRGGYY